MPITWRCCVALGRLAPSTGNCLSMRAVASVCSCYWPIHLQPYYQRLGFRVGDYPSAETYARTCFSLPLFPSLSNRSRVGCWMPLPTACVSRDCCEASVGSASGLGPVAPTGATAPHAPIARSRYRHREDWQRVEIMYRPLEKKD